MSMVRFVLFSLLACVRRPSREGTHSRARVAPGLFLATLLGVNNAAMFATRNVPHPLAHQYRAAAGGFLAAALAFPFLPSSMQPSASLFTLVRAIELFFRVLAKNGTVSSCFFFSSLSLSPTPCARLSASNTTTR